MDWFRWWHGTLTDPKFRWVARKSGCSFTAVITLWVALLERASTVTDGDAQVTRGDVTGFDCDAHDALLDVDDGSCSQILDAFVAKGLIENGRIANWDKRQAKREDSSAERMRAYRERKAAEKNVTHGDVTVTHGDAELRIVTHREEEIREDLKPKPSVGSDATAPTDDLLGSVPSLPCPAEKLRDLYHAAMPDNPKVKLLNAQRRRAMASRWREAARMPHKPFGYSTTEQGLEAWKQFFEVCATSDFLTGKAKAQPGKLPFLADIDFIFSPHGFVRCLENKYHRDAA
jgi:hypothetical protein